MTAAVSKSSQSIDDATVSRLKDLLARTVEAYELMAAGSVAPAMLQLIRNNLGQMHSRLGAHYLAVGATVEAIDSARQAHALQPADRDTAMLLARALLVADDTAAALPILVQTSFDHPADAGVHALLAQVYLKVGYAAEAVGSFRDALLLRPGDVTLTVALANALVAEGRPRDSLPLWREVLAVMPDSVDYLWRYGALCNDSGLFDEARAAFAKLIVLQPGKGLFHRLFGKLHSYANEDPHIARMEALLPAAAERSDDARELHLALFNAYEAVGDYDRAFGHLRSANDIRRQQLNYRPELFNRLFENIRTAFESHDRVAFAPLPRDESPIFIVGMPRSGSTLVEQILDSHPDVTAIGETPAFGALVEKHMLQRDLTYDLRPLDNAGSIRMLGDAYFAAIGRTENTGRRTVDKYLSNFLSIGIIKAIFPAARIVHCYRNPLANCFSAYASHFETTGLGYKADMEETARYYVRYAGLMRFWKQLYGDDILDLSYEALTLDHEAETKRLLAYCGLSWNPACLDFQHNDRAVKTASYMQVRQPIYSGIDRRTQHYIQHLEPMIRILREAGLHPGTDTQ